MNSKEADNKLFKRLRVVIYSKLLSSNFDTNYIIFYISNRILIPSVIFIENTFVKGNLLLNFFSKLYCFLVDSWTNKTISRAFYNSFYSYTKV
jgi:hypothetical protein